MILPQTIHFSSQPALEASARVFQGHPDVTIMVRDWHSHTVARQHFASKVLLVPDAAHYLWRRLDCSGNRSADECRDFALLRHDKEAAVPSAASHSGRPPAGDWLDLVPRWRQHLFGMVWRLHLLEGLVGRDLRAQGLWYRQLDLIVDRAVRTISTCGAIRSDRLHACLLGLLLGKPVFRLDNSYGKLQHYFDAWFGDAQDVAPEVRACTTAI